MDNNKQVLMSYMEHQNLLAQVKSGEATIANLTANVPQLVITRNRGYHGMHHHRAVDSVNLTGSDSLEKLSQAGDILDEAVNIKLKLISDSALTGAKLNDVVNKLRITHDKLNNRNDILVAGIATAIQAHKDQLAKNKASKPSTVVLMVLIALVTIGLCKF